MKVSVTYTVKIYDINKTIELIEDSNADYIHVDMFDGKFVPTKNYEMDELNVILANTKKKLDVHVMVENPLDFIEPFAKLNTEYYTFHYEAVKDVDEVINKIKESGLKAGIAINPETNVENIKPYLDKIDMVLVMSVKPGWGGQQFNEEVLTKIEELSKLKGNFVISVDGGVNEETAKKAINAGVDILVVGSYICKSDNYNERINTLKCL